MKKRDEFSSPIKKLLAQRVGYKCSFPDCRKSTSGPNSNPSKSINNGVAAHITAAKEGGPRYDARLTVEERKSADNGIWMCTYHANLIDKDSQQFDQNLIKEWKLKAEQDALAELIDENYRLRKELETVLVAIEGKDTYPLLEFVGCTDVNQMYYQLVISNSKHRPLYDVIVRIYDPEEVEESKFNGMNTLKTLKLYNTINIGNLPPSLILPIREPEVFPKKGYFHFFSYIGTRNGVYHQEIYCFPKDKFLWEIATKLRKHIDDTTFKVIYEYIPEQYKDLKWII